MRLPQDQEQQFFIEKRLDEMQAMQAIENVVEKRWNGKTHLIDTYRFINQVPLRDGEDAL